MNVLRFSRMKEFGYTVMGKSMGMGMVMGMGIGR